MGPELVALLRILDRQEHKESTLRRNHAATLESEGLVKIISNVHCQGLSHNVKLTHRGEEFLRELRDN